MSSTMADSLRPPLQSTARPSDREPGQDDLEKLRAWHEERLQRRLRDEYVGQQLHLAELVCVYLYSIDLC